LVSARPLAYMADLPRSAPAIARSAADSVADERAPARATGDKGSWLLPVLLGVGVMLAALTAVGAWLLVRQNRPSTVAEPAPSPAGTERSSAAAAAPPSAAPGVEAPVPASAAASAPATSAGPAESAAPDAMVKFQCQPGCDSIECDGTALESLAGVRLTAGTHRCRATKPGYRERSDEILVKAGVDQTHVFRLRPEPPEPRPAEARPEKPRPSEPRPTETRKPSGAGKGEKKKQPCGTFINPCK
jgi:hypothetical protein